MSTNKTSAPVLGFNHNLKFGSRVYHVQTEDSGLPHAHYITHLFVGGNVLASMKTNYNDKAGAPDLSFAFAKQENFIKFNHACRSSHQLIES